MNPSDLSDEDLELVKKKRLNFLKSCYEEFKTVAVMKVNKVTNNYEKVWCIEEWFDRINRRHFENVDPIRRELLDQTHLIDRHKVASCFLYHIMDSCPLCYENETLDKDDKEKRLLNACFASYVAVMLIHKWHKAYGRDFSLTGRAIKFILENRKWLAGSLVIHIQLMAQTTYLLEQLCVVEGEYARYSCINDDAATKCRRNRQYIVPEYIVPIPPIPVI